MQYIRCCPLVTVQMRSMELAETPLPAKYTRDERGLSFQLLSTKYCCRVASNGLGRYIPEKPGREPACVVDCDGSVVTSGVTGPNPEGGVIGEKLHALPRWEVTTAPGGALSSQVGPGTAGSAGIRDPVAAQPAVPEAVTRARPKGVGGCRSSRVAVPFVTGGQPSHKGDHPEELAGTVPRNGPYDRYSWRVLLTWQVSSSTSHWCPTVGARARVGWWSPLVSMRRYRRSTCGLDGARCRYALPSIAPILSVFFPAPVFSRSRDSSLKGTSFRTAATWSPFPSKLTSGCASQCSWAS